MDVWRNEEGKTAEELLAEDEAASDAEWQKAKTVLDRLGWDEVDFRDPS